jgi:hypothetical protein
MPMHLPAPGRRGNVTTVQRLVSGSTNLTQSYSYFDTETIYQATDTNGAQTTYSYGNCGNSFASTISLPLSLSTTQVWNCSGGVQTSATDANAKTTSWGFADPNFWRPTQATFPNGGSSYYS